MASSSQTTATKNPTSADGLGKPSQVLHPPDTALNFKVPSTIPSGPKMDGMNEQSVSGGRTQGQEFGNNPSHKDLEEMQIELAKELPDMVPVSLRHSLPEFSHLSIQSILAGLLLTWDEFFGLFNVVIDPEKYVLKGTNGAKIDTTELIDNYVSTFKRKQKMYTVSLTRVIEAADGKDKTQNEYQNLASTPNHNQSKNKNDAASSLGRNSTEKDGASTTRHPSKRLKLLDEQKERERNSGIDCVAQNILQSQQMDPPPPAKRSYTRRDSKRPSVGSLPDSLGDISQYGEDDGTNQSTDLMETICNKQKRMDTTRLSKDSASTEGTRRRGRKPKPKVKQTMQTIEAIPPVTASTRGTDSSVDSSESEDEESREHRKLLKRYVIKYLTDKVSPRSFLRIRSELMAVREQDKYFKVTSLLPLTAGMMEQAFCRKVNE